MSFHTKKSVYAWRECLEIVSSCQNVQYFGQVLSHNKSEAEAWLTEVGVSNPSEQKYIRYITSHSFAGNVLHRRNTYTEIEVANRVRGCYAIRGNIASVAWNGVLKACCFDSEESSECGTIFDFANARTKDRYPLCTHCDPDWTSGFQ